MTRVVRSIEPMDNGADAEMDELAHVRRPYAVTTGNAEVKRHP